ncbi:MAG: DUF3224 domain-containing protein [Acidobacteria bacterium]|nr:DUF3224 domain-containing protein [Acidobacteriota bacterium]
MKNIAIPFIVSGWDAAAYDESTPSPTLSEVTVKKTFDSDEFKGDSVGKLLMCSSLDDSAGYTIMDRFFVEIDGRKGSFVAIHGGMTDEMKASGKIVPGSGTDELEGIHGTIEFKSDETTKTIILNYEL